LLKQTAADKQPNSNALHIHMFTESHYCTSAADMRKITSKSKSTVNINRKYTVDGRKEAGAVIVVKILVLAHIINLLPFSLGHLLLHQLWSHFFLIWIKATILPNNKSDHQQPLTLCSEFILYKIQKPITDTVIH